MKRGCRPFRAGKHLFGGCHAGFGLLALAAILISGCNPRSWSAEERDFARRYQEAHQSAQPEALMALYWLEGVESPDRFLIRLAVGEEILHPLELMDFAPVEPDDDYRYQRDGVTYGPSLTPVRRLHLRFQSPSPMEMSSLLGRHQGQLYLVAPRPIPGDSG